MVAGVAVGWVLATAGWMTGPSRAQSPATPVRSEKASFRVETVVDGLRNPWGFVRLPDERLLITERPGRLRIWKDGVLDPRPVDGLPPIYARGQGGLLDIQLHPRHAENGWIYLAYSADLNRQGHTRILRARLDGYQLRDLEILFSPPDREFTGSGVHFGCRMDFDAERFLYFSIGERGDMQQAQNLATAQGKTHRIHDDGRIPAGNPFVDRPGALATIWTYGNRNIQGLRVHRGTGDLWAVEHGPRGGDELNGIRKGLNYGWPVVTFGINYNGTPITDRTEAPGMEPPVIHWTPSIAVGGLDVYRGERFPGWKGNLFVTALAGQHVRRLEMEGRKVVHQESLLARTGRIRDIRCLDDGLVYVVYDEPGRIVRLVPAE